MKTFAQFIKEAVQTLASTEAKNKGLVADGHGDYYDKMILLTMERKKSILMKKKKNQKNHLRDLNSNV